jgi:simple sugar transport system ATP-binding protein
LIREFDVRLQSPDQDIRFLSGGNQQKTVLARELSSEPRLLVVAQPTKGLDVGAIEFIQSRILEQRDRGTAILYISTELEHLLDVADRVGVMFRGRLVDTIDPADATAQRIGLLMAGIAA